LEINYFWFYSLFCTGPVQAANALYSESPILSAKVTAGELPAITERLPQNPVLIEPVENLGSYGGTRQMGMRGNADRAMIYPQSGMSTCCAGTRHGHG